MTDSVGLIEPRFSFLKAGTDEFSRVKNEDFKWDKARASVKTSLTEAFNARNVAFLLGAGCSSMKDCSGLQVGIPTMADLAREFVESYVKGMSVSPLEKSHIEVLEQALGLDIKEEKYRNDLERLMETLHSSRFVLNSSNIESHKATLERVNCVISDIQEFVWNKCINGEFVKRDKSVPKLYESFYRKLIFRDRSLPRPWVFTTNYDLFNETAMDRLGLPYTNGFSGVVERRFNPATFRYALAEQLDLTNRKWTAVDGFVYLCKLHGSVSWTEDDHGLFPIREIITNELPKKVMIYPTPAKQNASLASPYADLFREFQTRVVREQSVLVTIGYSFGDEHLNNIIYQALTIPTFRLVVFASPSSGGDIGKLRDLNDPRIWIVGGEGRFKPKLAHYFDTVVEEFMPDRPSEKIDDAVRRLVSVMKSPCEASDGE